jgi:hypothetical protein
MELFFNGRTWNVRIRQIFLNLVDLLVDQVVDFRVFDKIGNGSRVQASAFFRASSGR